MTVVSTIMMTMMTMALLSKEQSSTHAFSVNTNTAARSSLFRSFNNAKKGQHAPVPVPVPAAVAMNNMFSQLQMTSGDKDEETEVEPSSSSSDEQVQNEKTASTPSSSPSGQIAEPSKERNGFLTALIYGPPLIAKFGIVLLVKFVTDLVVFPLLLLYRLCKNAKNKVLGMIKGDDDVMKGDKINGSS